MRYALLILLMGLTGCGTICTRSTCGYNTFGSRPFEAVAQDVIAVDEACTTYADALQVSVATFCIISMPADLALDTICLPVDAVAWMYECQKQPAWRFSWNW